MTLRFQITLSILLVAFSAFGSQALVKGPLDGPPPYEAPETIEHACDDNTCTPAMQSIYDHFNQFQNAPQYIPGMYSGVCYHQSRILDPDTTHYIGLLIDQHPQGFYMAPTFQFFGDDNDMKDWTLTEARKQANPEWLKIGPMVIHPTSATEFVLDQEGYPVYVYWARQDLDTKTIYFLAFARGLSLAFCEAHPNNGGFQ